MEFWRCLLALNKAKVSFGGGKSGENIKNDSDRYGGD
jgi:hypothetical protein